MATIRVRVNPADVADWSEFELRIPFVDGKA